jgi:hypothetical protein
MYTDSEKYWITRFLNSGKLIDILFQTLVGVGCVWVLLYTFLFFFCENASMFLGNDGDIAIR